MNNELVLSTKDLTDVGISSQLTSNDLVEVVAHDIYNKYLDSVNDVIKRGKKLTASYDKLMDFEVNKMKAALSKYKYIKPEEKISVVSEDDIDEDEDNETNTISASFSGVAYWPTITILNLVVKEKDKGTIVEKTDMRLSMPILKSQTTKVKLTLATGTIPNKTEVKVGSIAGTIEERVSKTFTQHLSISTTRFREYAKNVTAFNKEVTTLLEFLPKNGALSVERFTREARVKMNSKIISAQSPDFRKKISQLFNIKL